MYYILLILIISSLFIAIITRKKYRLISELLCIAILTYITFMIGFRYYVGLDYGMYENNFNYYYEAFSFEYIYSILMYVIKVRFDKFYYLTFIMILLTNIFIYLGLKKRNVKNIYLVLSIFIYISNIGLVFMNLMRQGVAVAIFFYCSEFIKERNLKKYVLFMLIGAGFHSSILVMLPMYFIKKIRFTTIKYLFFVFLSYILVFTKLSQKILNSLIYLMPKYSNKYYNGEFVFDNNIKLLSIGILLNVIFVLLIIIFSNRNKSEEYLEEGYYVIGVIISILAISTFMFDRIGIYFFIFGIVAIPRFISNIKNKNKKLIFGAFSVIIATSFFVNSLFINPTPNMMEYKSVFSIE